MHHVTFGEKSLLVSSATSALLVRYAALLESMGDAETVDIPALDADGNGVIATLVVSPGVALASETTTSPLPDPDNAEADAELRRRIHDLEHPAEVTFEATAEHPAEDDWELP